jgi:hypothetical protein
VSIVVTFLSNSSNSVSIVSLLIVHYHIASCLLAFLRFLGRRYTVIPRSPHCRYLPHAREISILRQTSRGLSGIRSLPYTIFSTHTQHHGLSRTLVVLLSWEEYFPANMDIVAVLRHVLPRQNQESTGNTFLDAIGTASQQRVGVC